MASVSARRSPRTGVVSYRVQFRIDGRMTSETFPDPADADLFAAQVDRLGGSAAREMLERRRGNVHRVESLREFTARYLDRKSGMLTGIEDGTRAGYATAADISFLRFLGDYPVDTITRTDVGRWVAWQEEQPSTRRPGQKIAAKTIRNYQGLLSTIMAAAVDAGLIAKNPAHGIRLSAGTSREAVFLSPAQFKTVLHFIPPYYKPLVEFMAGTGTRWGEATALKWNDIVTHGKTPTARIDEAWKKAPGGPVLSVPKTKKSRRTISLYPALVTKLGDRGPGDELVFKGKRSNGRLHYARFRESTWLKAVAKAMDRELCASLGLEPVTTAPNVHDLRHTHASWMIAAGIPLPYIQARLGHESITTTVNTYGHLVPEAHEMMATAIENTLDHSPVTVHELRDAQTDAADAVLELEVAG